MQDSSRAIRAALCLLLLLSWNRLATSAPLTQLDFDIPEGDARDTLAQYRAQTGLQMLFGYDDVRGIRTNAVRGHFDSGTALQRMLKGTRIRYEFYDPDTVTLTVVPPARVRRPPKRVPEEREPAHEDIPGVVIAGTRWAPYPALASSELLALTRTDVERTGRATIAQVIRTLPQVFGGGPSEDTFTSSTGREARTNSARGSGVNLRGLDAGSTLVLLNGHRLALGGTEALFADLTSVPLGIIDRIEILPEGAGPLYGADSVGGVVNLITRTAADGTRTEVRYGGAAGRQLESVQLSHVAASTWESGSGLISAEIASRDALQAASRAQATSDLRRWGGDNFGSLASNPGTLLVGTQTFALPSHQDGTQIDPRQLQVGTRNFGDLAEGTDVIAGEKRASLFGSFRQALTPQREWYAEALFTERRSDANNSAFATVLSVPPTNPYWINPVSSGPVQVAYSFIDDFGPLHAETRIDTLNSAVGIREHLANWQLSADLEYAFERQHQTTDNVVKADEFVAALADSDPATAFNPFGDGSRTNSATLAKIRGTSRYAMRSSIGTARVTAVGDLGDLPGGAASLVTGCEARNQRFGSELFDAIATRTMASQVQRHVQAAFGQLSVPILAASDPGERARLALSLAVRHEEYSDFGATTTPRFGFAWSPLAAFTLRGSWGTAFRPPSLADLDESANVVSVAQQRGSGNAVPVLVWTGKNAKLKEERARSVSAGFDLALGPAFKFATTYYRVGFRDRITSIPYSDQLLNDTSVASRVLAPTDPLRAEVCRATFLGTPEACLTMPIAAILDLRLRNQTRQRTDGIDVLTQFERATSMGRWLFELNANYVFDFADLSGNGWIERVSTAHEPVDFRARAATTWQWRQWEATGIINYMDDYRDVVSIPARHVSSWTTVDLNLVYRLPQHSHAQTSVALSTQNLLNTSPPFLNNPVGIGYDQENGDLTRRGAAISIRHSW